MRGFTPSRKSPEGLCVEAVADSILPPEAAGPYAEAGREDMQLWTLRRLLIDELQELYIAESMIEESIGRLQMGADAKELKEALRRHGEETRGHAKRLEEVFRALEVNPRGGHASSLKALLREGEDRLGSGGDPHVVDAGVIAAARRVEHWEIAGYETMRIYAERLGLAEVAKLLGSNLEEEKAADQKLTQLAEKLDLQGQQEA